MSIEQDELPKWKFDEKQDGISYTRAKLLDVVFKKNSALLTHTKNLKNKNFFYRFLNVIVGLVIIVICIVLIKTWQKQALEVPRMRFESPGDTLHGLKM